MGHPTYFAALALWLDDLGCKKAHNTEPTMRRAPQKGDLRKGKSHSVRAGFTCSKWVTLCQVQMRVTAKVLFLLDDLIWTSVSG